MKNNVENIISKKKNLTTAKGRTTMEIKLRRYVGVKKGAILWE
jgi:hypothetical protein